jgi:CheY-like chemotaxis protein
MSSSLRVSGSRPLSRRVLVVDDNPSIHTDFRKILCPGSPATRKKLETLEASLFGPRRSVSSASLVPSESNTVSPRMGRPGPAPGSALEFTVDFELQGQHGLEAVRRMMKAKTPYALAFVDMRMPPGWDGIETAVHIWEEDPAIQIVICSAYSDYSWNEVVRRVNRPGLRLLHKPFDAKDVLDLAWTMTTKWLNRMTSPPK